MNASQKVFIDSNRKRIYRQPGRILFAKHAGFMPPYGPASEKSIRQKVKK